jgi:hypothetical protein
MSAGTCELIQTIPAGKGYVVTQLMYQAGAGGANLWLAVGGCDREHAITPGAGDFRPGVSVPAGSDFYLAGGTGEGTAFVNGYYFDQTP